ncbi:MAG: SpoIID/LytB domain-containing protein [Thermodesulfobacteriota bacterium]
MITLKNIIYKICFTALFLIFFTPCLYSNSLYLQTMDLAREYILEKNFNKAGKEYLFLTTQKNLNKEQTSNTYLLYGLNLWKNLNKPEKANKVFKKITKEFKNTQSAGDALFFLSIMAEENSDLLQKKKYLEKLASEYPYHVRAKTADKILKNFKADSEPDRLNIKVLIDTSDRHFVSGESKLSCYNETLESDRLTITLSENKTIKINSKDTLKKEVIISSPDSIINFNKKKYSGSILFYESDNSIRAVNILSLKKYLKSVVPSEMPSSWHKEALRAQAVVSRTYALYMIEKNKNKKYHLDSSTWSQVYKGIEAESKPCSDAVDSTYSELLTFDRKTVLAAFHSNSGGYTEDPDNFWDKKYSYLTPSKDRFTPLNSWTAGFSYTELSEKIFKSKKKIYNIKILEKTGSGRVYKILLQTDKGRFYIRGDKFRQKTGIHLVKSTLFKIRKVPNGIMVSGRGFGHGVGMSQWGAKKMAEKGYNYKDIIKYYFSHKISIVKILPDSFYTMS